jgi:hypothetical protein
MAPTPDNSLDVYDASRNGPTLAPRKARRRPRHEFIRGPLPVWWLAKAAELPGQALAVGLAVWFRRGIEKARTFPLYPSALAKFGVNRWSFYRALKALEEVGLLAVSRKRGRSPVVTVLDCPTQAEGEPVPQDPRKDANVTES